VTDGQLPARHRYLLVHHETIPPGPAGADPFGAVRIAVGYVADIRLHLQSIRLDSFANKLHPSADSTPIADRAIMESAFRIVSRAAPPGNVGSGRIASALDAYKLFVYPVCRDSILCKRGDRTLLHDRQVTPLSSVHSCSRRDAAYAVECRDPDRGFASATFESIGVFEARSCGAMEHPHQRSMARVLPLREGRCV